MSILVSINCVTYNHEKFISKAIEGFLSQKTNFEYEILIYDDASTDNTAEIIRYYENKYPEVIKPIYQSQNQYSRGVRVSSFNFNRARGKYIADCEGDDYWTDVNKLQKQVDYLENNPGCTLCFHNAEIINENDLSSGRLVINKDINSRKYTAGELAILGFIPTASKMYLKSTFMNLPEWHSKSVVADYPSQLIVTSHGYAYYINEVMSNYRMGSFGSATDRFNKKTTQEKVEYIKGFIDILNNFDEYSNFKYSTEIDQAKILWEIRILELEKRIKELKKPRYKEYYSGLGIKEKIKQNCRTYFPTAYFKLAAYRNYAKYLINKIQR